MEDLKDLLFNNNANVIKGKYIKDETKAKAFVEAEKLLGDLLFSQGNFAYKADDVNTPQYIHQIEIRWLNVETELPGHDIAEILGKLDTFSFSREQIMADTWILSSEIYKEEA